MCSCMTVKLTTLARTRILGVEAHPTRSCSDDGFSDLPQKCPVSIVHPRVEAKPNAYTPRENLKRFKSRLLNNKTSIISRDI